jgi:sensor histidine kinase regulating citrate/malate metabolism
MELNLSVGEPSLWRVYKTTILGVVIGLYGVLYIYSHIKKAS